MNIRRLRRLLILFFTRPIRLADLGTAWHSLRRQPVKNTSRTPDFEPTRMINRPEDVVDAWGRSHQVDVSEEPLHTLPAALQDEFSAATTRKGSSAEEA